MNGYILGYIIISLLALPLWIHTGVITYRKLHNLEAQNKYLMIGLTACIIAANAYIIFRIFSNRPEGIQFLMQLSVLPSLLLYNRAIKFAKKADTELN